jgi:hypothetical protein
VITVTSTQAARQLGAAAIVVLTVVLGAGCGGEDAAADSRCLAQAYNAAEAAAVAELYESGELGSKANVRSELERGGMRFFDGEDRMIPYDELSSAEQNQLVAWFSNGPVGRLTEQERERAVERADPDC